MHAILFDIIEDFILLLRNKVTVNPVRVTELFEAKGCFLIFDPMNMSVQHYA